MLNVTQSHECFLVVDLKHTKCLSSAARMRKETNGNKKEGVLFSDSWSLDLTPSVVS